MSSENRHRYILQPDWSMLLLDIYKIYSCPGIIITTFSLWFTISCEFMKQCPPVTKVWLCFGFLSLNHTCACICMLQVSWSHNIVCWYSNYFWIWLQYASLTTMRNSWNCECMDLYLKERDLVPIPLFSFWLLTVCNNAASDQQLDSGKPWEALGSPGNEARIGVIRPLVGHIEYVSTMSVVWELLHVSICLHGLIKGIHLHCTFKCTNNIITRQQSNN